MDQADYSVDRVQQLPTRSGIYAIANTSNGERYVGQARNIRARIATHIRDLDRGLERTNADMLLQKAWIKYGRSAFVIRVLELVEDNEHSTVTSVRVHNLALAEHYYISLGAAYNKDTKIVRSDQFHLIESRAWRYEIDSDTINRIANAPRNPYKVGTRVAFGDAVIVSAHNENEAKEIARSVSLKLAALGNLSSRRLSLSELRNALDDEVPDFRGKMVSSTEAADIV